MKYAIQFLGLITLSALTHSAYVPFAQKEPKDVTLPSNPKQSGPEFPIVLYKKGGRNSRNDRNARKKRTRKRDEWLNQKGEPHCMAEGHWDCLRQCMKGYLDDGYDPQNSSSHCDNACKAEGKSKPGGCTTTDDSDFGGNIAKLREEVAEEKKEQEEEARAQEEEARKAKEEADKAKKEAEDQKGEATKPKPTPKEPPARIPELENE